MARRTASKMNKHPQPETLSAYIDAMLDVAQMHHTALHLHSCSACRSACSSLREMRDLIHHLPAPPAPSRDYWTNAYRQVRVDTASPQRTLSVIAQVRHSLAGTQRRWAAGAAAAALLGISLAAPLVGGGHHALPTRASAIAAPDVVDLSALVRDHAQSAAVQPLADSDRQAMLSADADDGAAYGDPGTEAAGNGSSSSDAAP